MTWGIFKADGVSEAYKKMKEKQSCATEELKGDQHKLDVNKNGKVDGEDLSKLRATKEEVENVEEGWDEMLKHAKEKNGPQPNGGAGKKQGTRYGGSKQKDDDKKDDVKEDVEQIDELSTGAIKNYIKKAKENKKFEADTQATAIRKNDHMMASDSAHAIAKRKEGIKTAKAKLNKEEVEQIDELSKGTLASYAKKATNNARMQQSIGKDFEKQADKSRKPGMKAAAQSLADKYKSKSRSREAGVGKAIDRLAKEDISYFELDQMVNEVLSTDEPAGKWIQDFVKSTDPKFAGDSKEQRIKRALGAYYAAQRNESTDYAFFAEYTEPSVVKGGAKEIKHDNMKEKQATRDEMETHSDSEQAFVDAHSIKDEEEPAKKAGNDQSGKEKVGKATEPKGQGAATYNGDSKLSDKDKAKVTAEAVIKTEAGEEIDTEPKEKEKKKTAVKM